MKDFYQKRKLNIIDMIKDVEKALDAEAYFSGFVLSMAIIDKCTKVENNGRAGRKNFEEWSDKYLFTGYKDVDRKTSFGKMLPYMSGEILYQLRCSFVHELSSEINPEQIKDEDNKKAKFNLILDEYNEFQASSINSVDNKNNKQIDIYIIALCHQICIRAQQYYDENQEKFRNEIELIDYRIKHNEYNS